MTDFMVDDSISNDELLNLVRMHEKIVSNNEILDED